MSDITINYKGSSIATMDASGTKTLLTEGKYCEDDIEIVYVSPGGGGGTQTISFLDWTQQGSTNTGAFQSSNTRIACKHGLYKCRSISIFSGVEVAFGAALFPYIGAKIDAASGFVGFWSGSSYSSSFTWFNSQTIDLTQFADWSDNYFVMFLRHPNNSNISPSEGNNVVVTYDPSDGAVIINEMR